MTRATIFNAAVLAIALGGMGANSALAAGQSAAQIPTGKMSDGDRGRITARAVAECLLKRKPVWVERLLGVPNPKSTRMLEQADMDECLDGGSLSFKADLMRGALFGAKYRSVYAVSAVAPTMTPAAEIFYAVDRASDPSFYSTLLIADCVVGKGPEVARQVILTRPATPENSEAYRALLPNLTACLTKGVTARISKANIDGFLAEALYRRTVSTVAPAPAKGA